MKHPGVFLPAKNCRYFGYMLSLQNCIYQRFMQKPWALLVKVRTLEIAM